MYETIIKSNLLMTTFVKFKKSTNPMEVNRQLKLREKIISCVTTYENNCCILNCGYYKEKIKYDSYPMDYNHNSCPDYILLVNFLNDKGITGVNNAPICDAYDLIDKDHTGIEICYNVWNKQIEFSRYTSWF